METCKRISMVECVVCGGTEDMYMAHPMHEEDCPNYWQMTVPCMCELYAHEDCCVVCKVNLPM